MPRSISFVLPMYNESANITETLRKVSRLASELSDDYEIVIVDDASKDNSADVVEKLALNDSHIKLIRLNNNTKFGGALGEGLRNVSKEVAIYTDADLPVREDDVKKGLALLGEADVITGYSMVIKDAAIKRIVMSKVYNFLVQFLFGLSIKDINSGFKIYKSEVLKGLNLISRSPFVDVEIFAEAKRRGFKIKQFGLLFELRTQGVSTISRLSVVIRTFWDMFKYKFLK
ncbi:MAG: glycosyltransferase [Candidatus Omnitrophota bacterium]|nr:glycosyltransferase [Candidatus Omnitrophota bacterium]